jgi:hypothetical protein
MTLATHRCLLLGFVVSAAVHPLNSAAQAPAERSDSIAATSLVAEAEAFMAGYADDLRRGDRAALAERYDRAGVHELRPARVRRSTHESIATRYEVDWQPPSAFEWRELMYDVAGPGAVVVSGLFAWTRQPGGGPEVQSYTALLRRQPDGRLAIRLEAEAGLPVIPWQLLGGGSAILALVAAGLGWIAGRRHAEARTQPVGASTTTVA